MHVAVTFIAGTKKPPLRWLSSLSSSLSRAFDLLAALGVIKDALADAQALWGDFEQLVVRQILDS